ncbi:hypothetical protein V5799_020489 [Amblyomma americanum]|uniref:Peptidase M13 N-terminal domain-containing protein n=1 Tax=Amblyomma americanum TaxID=6943 RepID=A0AAQ4ETZ8_AMBAM
MEWPEETQPAVGGVDPLDLMLDLAINWNLNFLFDVRVLELPRHAASATRDSAVALVLSRGKLSYVWQEGVRKSVDQTQYESYVQMYYQLLSVKESNVSATTLRELEEAILAAKMDIVADESEQQVWFKIRALDNETSSLDPGTWLALFNKQFSGQFTWSGEHWIVVDGPAVLARLDKLLKTYSKHLLVVGLAWVFVQTHLWAVANKPDLAFDESRAKARKYGCFEYAESLFGLLSVAEHLTHTFGTGDARHHLSYFERTLASAVARKLHQSSWIHDGPRNAALRKLESLSMALLPPSEFFDKAWRQAFANGYAMTNKTQAVSFTSNTKRRF